MSGADIRPGGRGQAIAALVAVLGVGCAGAGGPGSGPGASGGPDPGAVPEAQRRAPDAPAQESPFPTPEELESLIEQGAPRVGSLADDRFLEVERWTLRGPFPERAGEEPLDDPGPWERVLLEVARDRAGLLVVSESMRCVARELGLFLRAHDALPTGGLQNFIAGRCGATGTDLRMGTMAATVPADAPEERIAEGWGDDLRMVVRENLGAGARAAGIWFGRRGDRGLVLIVTAARRARLEPAPLVAAEGGGVWIRGELLQPAEALEARVNQGRIGVASCAPDPEVELPRFAFRCPVRGEDETAWIALHARTAGRLLATSVLRVLARPGAGAARTWQRPDYGATGDVESAEEFRERLLEVVNRLREEAGHPPVALERNESRTAESLAPLYFGAGLGLVDPAVGDLAALGLMAGWEVGGVIRDAGIGAFMALRTRDLGRWLGEALLDPAMRTVLLGPEQHRLAVGPVVSGQGAFLAAVVVGYALYGERDPAELRERFYVYLNRALDARDRAFPRRDRELEALAARHAARVAAGSATPERAAGALAQEAATQLGVEVRGWYLEGTEADAVFLPDELLAGDADRIAAAVTWYRPSGWPWGRTVVLLVAAPDAPLRTAHAPPPHPTQKGTFLRTGREGQSCPTRCR